MSSPPKNILCQVGLSQSSNPWDLRLETLDLDFDLTIHEYRIQMSVGRRFYVPGKLKTFSLQTVRTLSERKLHERKIKQFLHFQSMICSWFHETVPAHITSAVLTVTLNTNQSTAAEIMTISWNCICIHAGGLGLSWATISIQYFGVLDW